MLVSPASSPDVWGLSFPICEWGAGPGPALTVPALEAFPLLPLPGGKRSAWGSAAPGWEEGSRGLAGLAGRASPVPDASPVTPHTEAQENKAR